MIVITETRYGGVYEGGPWAAFSITAFDAIPDDAFSGDPFVSGWWEQPSVPVGVGDSPDDALDRLRHLMLRDQEHREAGVFAVGDTVRAAQCTPDDWYGSGNGIVRVVEFHPCRPFAGGLRGQCVYTVDFDNVTGVRVPERYLRRRRQHHDSLSRSESRSSAGGPARLDDRSVAQPGMDRELAAAASARERHLGASPCGTIDR